MWIRADVMDGLGNQAQKSPCFVPCQGAPGSGWRGALHLVLGCRIRPAVLPEYAPDPTTKSGLAFGQVWAQTRSYGGHRHRHDLGGFSA